MNPINELHRQAMNLAEEAYLGSMFNRKECEYYRSPAEVKELNRQACELENQAADMVEVGQEPTRGILYRSAAWLAFHAGDLEKARKLVETGLAGNPPGWIKDELNDVIVAVNTEDQHE